MTQIATVTAAGTGEVEVTVTRRTACGHDCESCGGCGAGKTSRLVVRAETELPLEPGDRVEICSGGGVLGAAALVYLGPVVLFLAGYLLPSGAPEAARYACGGLGFALGLLGAVACDRRLRRKGGAVRYQVARKL